MNIRSIAVFVTKAFITGFIVYTFLYLWSQVELMKPTPLMEAGQWQSIYVPTPLNITKALKTGGLVIAK